MTKDPDTSVLVIWDRINTNVETHRNIRGMVSAMSSLSGLVAYLT